MLQHKNPYTGLRYVDDPALATVEMQNEDSVFFWNPLGELAKPDGKWKNHGQLLRRRFAAWVKRAQYESAVEVFTTNYDLLIETAFDIESVGIGIDITHSQDTTPGRFPKINRAMVKSVMECS